MCTQSLPQLLAPFTHRKHRVLEEPLLFLPSVISNPSWRSSLKTCNWDDWKRFPASHPKMWRVKHCLSFCDGRSTSESLFPRALLRPFQTPFSDNGARVRACVCVLGVCVLAQCEGKCACMLLLAQARVRCLLVHSPLHFLDLSMAQSLLTQLV